MTPNEIATWLAALADWPMKQATKKRPAYDRFRCHYCRRVLTLREWAAGLAAYKEVPFNGYLHEETAHTYDCEHEPRRKP